MLLPNSCDALLNVPYPDYVNSIVASPERTLALLVTDSALLFYLADTHLLVCIYQRDAETLHERGPFRKAFWKPDSKAVCVTANNCLNIFAIDVIASPPAFNLHDPSGSSSFLRTSSELFLAQNRPQVNVTLSVVAHLEAAPTSILSFKDELIVCLTDGWLHRLSWAGSVLQDLSFNIRSFMHDHQHGGTTSKIDRHVPSNIHVVDIAPFLAGICIVLNDGRAALLISTAANFQPDSINILWAIGLSSVSCCATNFKYRIIYYGCNSGEIIGYSLDDLNGTLTQLFTIRLTLKNGTECLERLRSVRQIRCLSPSGDAFAVIWNMLEGSSISNPPSTSSGISTQKLYASSVNEEVAENSNPLKEDALSLNLNHQNPPVLAIFSPFGAQWWCSLEDNVENSNAIKYTTMDWLLDGYQLWIGTNEGVQLINMVHSTENLHSHVLMVGSDRIYLSPSTSLKQTAACSAPHLIWQIFKPPHNYISLNGPIKFIATDYECNKFIAVAGTHGFCFYNFKKDKWRIFRTESQERSLLITGGLLIIENTIFCSASNLDSSPDEKERIFSFNTEKQLDLELASSILTSRILQMTLSRYHVLTFDVNSLIGIYSVSKIEPNTKDHALECLAEVRIAEFLPHPNCLVAMDLTKLNFHSDTLPFCDDLDSLLVNISGQLLLLSSMHHPQANDGHGHSKKSQDDVVTEFQLHHPTLIASFVEQFWTTSHCSPIKGDKTRKRIPFLEDALWVNAGCKNSKVWLPLSSEQSLDKPSTGQPKILAKQHSRSFISRRIMLPVELDIYPLSVNYEYLACGASCVSSHLKISAVKFPSDNLSLATEDGSSLCSYVGISKTEDLSRLAVHNLVRVGEVFIHKLLKQLLKRNLGAYAFELATACRPLSYFGHILELLLHDLLNEEATSSEPIPDPLLPTAVAFLQEFPAEYLQTIVYCARKSEPAFWNLLFSVSHHPRQLFQMCLDEGQLDTASSCLMILHSMENLLESSKLASRLLEEALEKRRWTMAQDIARFMQNISHAASKQEVPDLNRRASASGSTIQKKLSTLNLE